MQVLMSSFTQKSHVEVQLPLATGFLQLAVNCLLLLPTVTIVVTAGIEPATQGFSVLCSTN